MKPLRLVVAAYAQRTARTLILDCGHAIVVRPASTPPPGDTPCDSEAVCHCEACFDDAETTLRDRGLRRGEGLGDTLREPCAASTPKP